MKNSLKEFKFYLWETEHKKQKLQKNRTDKEEKSDIKTRRYSVEETEGVKITSYNKFIEPLKEVIAKIEANDSNDEEYLKEIK